MTETAIIAAVAMLASVLTFFSGFGLGTLLTPVFAIFFPIELAIALTGVVHFVNNIFKLGLVGRHAVGKILLRFGVPAVIFAWLGAKVLVSLSDLQPLFTYAAFGNTFLIMPVKLIIAILLIFFAIADLFPLFEKWKFGEEKLPLGGALSGFFGGLSGNQGAFRSAFLIKLGLSKEAFIGTSVVIACFIDLTRLSVYSTRFYSAGLQENLQLVVIASLAAICGAVIGNRLLKKITIDFIQKTVAVLLILIALALGLGWI